MQTVSDQLKPKIRYAVATGRVQDGFSFEGPFETEATAVRYAERLFDGMHLKTGEPGWTIVEMTQPTDENGNPLSHKQLQEEIDDHQDFLDTIYDKDGNQIAGVA
jgi:hypothetical protein